MNKLFSSITLSCLALSAFMSTGVSAQRPPGGTAPSEVGVPTEVAAPTEISVPTEVSVPTDISVPTEIESPDTSSGPGSSPSPTQENAPSNTGGAPSPSSGPPGQCAGGLNDFNYELCCSAAVIAVVNQSAGTINGGFYASSCQAYKPTFCAHVPNSPMCQVRGPSGGTQSTNSQQGGISSGTYSTSGSSQIATCSNNQFKTIVDWMIWLKCIITQAIIPLIFSLAFVVFLWGVFRVISADDLKKKQEGQKVIWYGILGLFVMVSVWGIIRIFSNILGIDSSVVPRLQTTPPASTSTTGH